MTSPLTTVAYQPTAPSGTEQLGSWTVVGAASGWQAVSDGSNTTYVELVSGICRLQSQVIELVFPTPSLPAGAQIYSVSISRTVQAAPTGSRVTCFHWFEAVSGTVAVGGQIPKPATTFFSSPLPTNSVTGQWITEDVYTSTTAPDGTAWNTATNLASGNFSYWMGRGDLSNVPILVSEVTLKITYQSESSVTVTGPAGTVSTTQPTLTWTYFNSNAQPQQGFQTAVYTQAQTTALGFTPFGTVPIDGTNGFVLGEDQQWTMNIDLTNDSYVAYVQAESQWAGPGSFLSGIGSTSWTRSASAPPGNASFTSAVFDEDNNRVGLTFAPGGASPATVAFTVYASRDGGQSWAPIPSLSYIPASGMSPITKYDEVAPLNEVSQYRVLAYGGSPLEASAGNSAVLSVTPTGERVWLKDPSNPLLNTVLPIKAPKEAEDGIKITMRRNQGTFQLLGGSGTQVLPFIVNGPTYGDEYEIELWFGEGDLFMPMTLWAPVDELDRSGNTLLLQFPDGTNKWVMTGPGASSQDTEERFFATPGDARVIAWRRRKLIMTEVDPPSYY